MSAGEQVSTEKKLRLQPKVMDPQERRRRLRKVYDILLALADQAEAAAVDTACDQPQAAD